MIVTFYSYKGGVGRSMALVNVAEILADRGYRVILVDWDLEAPGLERYLLGTEDPSADGARELQRLVASPGLMDLLAEYKQRVSLSAPESPEVDRDHALLGKIVVRRPSTWATPVSVERARSGSLRLLTAGRREDEHERRYSDLVTRFDWEDFYNRWAGGSYIEFFRRELVGAADEPGQCDILLIDSRTGVTEHGGICTHHLADLVILLSAANRANLSGIEWMAKSLDSPTLKALRGDREIEVLPVRARIDDSAQIYELTAFRREFMGMMGRYFPKALPAVEDLSLRLEIPYRALYSFQERAVAREPIQKREQRLYDAYSALADAILTIGHQRRLLPAKSATRVELAPVRARSFSPGEIPTLVTVTSWKELRPMAEVIVHHLRMMGFNIVADFECPPLVWLRSVTVAERFLVLLDPVQSDEQRNRLTPLLRQQALDADRRVIALSRDRETGAPFRGQSITLPATMDEPFFAALSEEIIHVQGPRLRGLDDRGRQLPGRSPFSEEDAPLFFGRESELLDVIGGANEFVRWINIGGPTGVGKTSFVNAALIPAIRADLVPAIPSGTEIVTWTFDRPSPPVVGKATVMVIDDLDRFLLHEDAEERKQMETALGSLLNDAESRIWVLSTMSRPLDQHFYALEIAQRMRSRMLRYDLAPLSVEGVGAAVRGPLKLNARTCEPGLIDRLIDALTPWRMAPAFICDALRRLLESSSVGTLSHDALRATGGVGALIAASAEDALASLESAGIRTPRVMETILKVVTADGASRPFPIKRVVATGGSERLVHDIAASGLIRIDEKVEIAHPLLPATWPQLETAIREQKAQLTARDAIEAAIGESQPAPARMTAILLGMLAIGKPGRMERLARTAGTLLPPQIARALRGSRIVLNIAIPFYALLLLILLGPPAYEKFKTQRRIDSLTVAARSEKDPAKALPLAIEAAKLSRTPASAKLLAAAIGNIKYKAVLQSEGVTSIWLESDRVMYTDSRTWLQVVYLDRPDTESWTLPLLHGERAAIVDESTAATAIGAVIRVHDLFQGTLTFQWEGKAPVSALSFGKDSLGAGDESGSVFEWRGLGTSPVQLNFGGEAVTGLAYSHDGSRLVVTSTAGEESRARLFAVEPSLSKLPWRVRTGRPLINPALNSDGRILASISKGAVLVWSTTSDARYVMSLPAKATVAAFDPFVPEALAVGTAEGTIYLRQLSGTSPHVITRGVLHGHRAPITHIHFDEANRGQLVSAAANGEIYVWNLQPPEIPANIDQLLDLAERRIPIRRKR